MNNKITIGITGHRDIVITNELIKNIKEFFISLTDKEVTLLSPLADGADRVVANIYLEVFKENAHLVVPMPFNQERCMEDFDTQSKEDFLNYIKSSKKVLEVKNTQGCNYQSVGVYVADKSDTLLALWDGTFNSKSGGTGDIVKYAREKNKKVVHFLCERRG